MQATINTLEVRTDVRTKPVDIKFIKAEEFFADYQTWDYIGKVKSYTYDQKNKQILLDVTSNAGKDYKIILYIPRKDTFRFRFNPINREHHFYPESNTRTVVMDTFSELTETMPDFTLEPPSEHFFNNEKLVELVTKEKGQPFMKIQINMDRYGLKVFQYTQDNREFLAHSDACPALYFKEIVFSGRNDVEYMVIQCKNKSGTAKYVGFGEKGGSAICKNSRVLNYFNFDNMRYKQVYNRGALDDREPLYHSNPFFLEFYGNPNEKSVNGIFVDNPSQVCMDIGSRNSNRYLFGTRFYDMDYYFFLGTSCAEIIDSYTYFVGTSPLYPRYVLGYHQGCYGYENRQRLEEVAHEYRKYQIPIDGLHIDVDIQHDYQTFTIDESKFPNPKEMFDNLRKMGFKCSTNITPIISNQDLGYSTYREGLENDYFVKDRRCEPLFYDGEKYQNYVDGQEKSYIVKDDNYNSGKSYVGEVFYGGDRGTRGHYPDLGRHEVRRWWGKQYEYLFKMGLEMVWQDMTTPCIGSRDDNHPHGDMRSFPYKLLISNDFVKKFNQDQNYEDPQAYSLTPFIKIINLYSYNLHKATYHGLNHLDIPERKNKRNFIIGRGSYSGMHRYAGLWTGDNSSNWHFMQINIAQMLALGISGQPIAGSDIGGFEKDEDWQKWADPELLIRWTALGAFLPWFRNHYIAKDHKDFQEPYAYQYVDLNKIPEGERYLYQAVLPVCKHYIELRYRLLQLFYDAMWDNTITGMPICRAMFLNDQADAALFNDKLPYLSTQFFVGQDLLVAPILEKQSPENAGGRRDIYLPAGSDWYCFMDNKAPLASRVEGGRTIHDFDASINPDPGHRGFIVPLYVRAGAIIPTIELEQYVGERNRNQQPNPITINIYPVKNAECSFCPNDSDGRYTMYMDDGVSRSSGIKDDPRLGYDEEAKSEYREIKITHQYVAAASREIRIKRVHDNYTPPFEKYFFVAVLHDPGEIYGNHGPLNQITLSGQTLPLLTDGSPEARADRLRDYAENAWYYNENTHVSVIKIFDDQPERGIGLEYLQH